MGPHVADRISCRTLAGGSSLPWIDLRRRDARIAGIAAGGSFITNLMDKFGDLDLIIAVDPLHYANVTGDRNGIAGSLGPLLAPITGEHVGELLHF